VDLSWWLGFTKFWILQNAARAVHAAYRRPRLRSRGALFKLIVTITIIDAAYQSVFHSVTLQSSWISFDESA
jgi:hypothetical protein